MPEPSPGASQNASCQSQPLPTLPLMPHINIASSPHKGSLPVLPPYPSPPTSLDSPPLTSVLTADAVLHKYAAKHRSIFDDKEPLPPYISQLANDTYSILPHAVDHPRSKSEHYSDVSTLLLPSLQLSPYMVRLYPTFLIVARRGVGNRRVIDSLSRPFSI